MELTSGVVARYWPKVARGDDASCWLWQNFVNPSGYGMLRVGGRMELSHRVAWTIEHGAIPVDLQVLHRCDVPACCNPAHLFLGTNAINVADKVAKGRSHFPRPDRRGEGHPMAKLTAEAVAEIRATTGHGSGRRLAAKFGVSPSTITIIRKGKIWAS